MFVFKGLNTTDTSFGYKDEKYLSEFTFLSNYHGFKKIIQMANSNLISPFYSYFSHSYWERVELISVYIIAYYSPVFFSRESILNQIGSWSPFLSGEMTSVTTVKTLWVPKGRSRFYSWISTTMCNFCLVSSQLLFSAENYVRHIQDNLDYLHKEVKSYLFCCMWSPSLHLPPLVKCSCLCPGASSYSELSRASLCHPSQGITHGPFPQMSNVAAKVREMLFFYQQFHDGRMLNNVTNNNILFC